MTAIGMRDLLLRERERERCHGKMQMTWTMTFTEEKRRISDCTFRVLFYGGD